MNGFPSEGEGSPVGALTDTMAALGAELEDVHGIAVPARFARPARSHLAVRNGVGVTRHPWGLLTVGGEDRHRFLDDTLTCRMPAAAGDVSYGFLLDPDGRIEVDMYVVDAGDRYLCLTAPGTAGDLATTLAGRTFIQDVAVEDVTGAHVVLGVHGPSAAAKLASVMPDGTPPADPLTMARGVLREQGVSVVRLDAPAGEAGYAVVCRAADGAAVFDALVSLGAMAAPFGHETWLALTLEAGTPLLETELAGRTPNVCGQLTAGVALEKGCFVGQEVVARIANLAEPRERVVGLTAPSLPDAGATVETPSGRAGVLTRRATSPALESTIGMAVVPAATAVGDAVAVDGVDATVAPLPFVEGGEASARRPAYGSGDR